MAETAMGTKWQAGWWRRTSRRASTVALVAGVLVLSIPLHADPAHQNPVRPGRDRAAPSPTDDSRRGKLLDRGCQPETGDTTQPHARQESRRQATQAARGEIQAGCSMGGLPEAGDERVHGEQTPVRERFGQNPARDSGGQQLWQGGGGHGAADSQPWRSGACRGGYVCMAQAGRGHRRGDDRRLGQLPSGSTTCGQGNRTSRYRCEGLHRWQPDDQGGCGKAACGYDGWASDGPDDEARPSGRHTSWTSCSLHRLTFRPTPRTSYWPPEGARAYNVEPGGQGNLWAVPGSSERDGFQCCGQTLFASTPRTTRPFLDQSVYTHRASPGGCEVGHQAKAGTSGRPLQAWGQVRGGALCSPAPFWRCRNDARRCECQTSGSRWRPAPERGRRSRCGRPPDSIRSGLTSQRRPLIELQDECLPGRWVMVRGLPGLCMGTQQPSAAPAASQVRLAEDTNPRNPSSVPTPNAQLVPNTESMKRACTVDIRPEFCPPQPCTDLPCSCIRSSPCAPAPISEPASMSSSVPACIPWALVCRSDYPRLCQWTSLLNRPSGPRPLPMCPHEAPQRKSCCCFSLVKVGYSFTWFRVSCVFVESRVLWALKSRIGSSGSTAMIHETRDAVSKRGRSACRTPGRLTHIAWPPAYNLGIWYEVGCACQAFFRSLATLVAVAMLQVYLGQALRRGSSASLLLRASGRLIPVKCLCAFEVANPTRPVLHWVPRQSTHARPAYRHKSPFSRCRALVTAVLGFASLPQCVWAAPPGAREFGVLHHHAESPTHGWPDTLEPADTAREIPRPAMPQYVELPCPRRDAPPFATSTWLGVSVFAPHSKPAAFGALLEKDTDLEALCSHIRTHGPAICRRHECLVPAHPQPHAGYLTLLSYPIALDAFCSRQCAVLLDLTRVGGPYYAAVISADVRVEDLLRDLREQITADPEERDIRVWVGDADMPASRGAPLALRHGVVLTFLVNGGRSLPISASSLVGADAVWGRLDHMPCPPKENYLAVCSDEILDVVDPTFFPGVGHDALALRACDTKSDISRAAILTDFNDLDVKGRGCNKVVAVIYTALERQGCTPYLLDLRALGIAPRQVTLDLQTPGPPLVVQLLAAARVTPPRGYAGYIAAAQTVAGVHIVTFGSFEKKGPNVEADVGCVSAPSDLPQASDTAAEEALDTADSTEAEHSDASSFVPPIRANFWVLRQYCTPLQVVVSLPTPATLEQAADAVSLSLPNEVYWYYPQIVPVHPQPSSQWGLVLALPQWATADNIVVFDLQTVDGRLFATTMPHAIRRDQLCRLAQVDPGGVVIYAYGSAHPLQPGVELIVQPAGCIFFVPHNLPPTVGCRLSHMLKSPHGWFLHTYLPRTVGGDQSRQFCLATEQAPRNYEIALSRGLHYRADVIAHLGLNPAQAIVQLATPRVTDASVAGYSCRGLIVAADTGTRPDQALAVVDCRPLMEGWHPLLFQEGGYSHSDLVDELSLFVPVDYQVQIDNARVDDGIIRLEPGQVLVAQYVPMTPPPSPPRPESSDSSPGAPDTDAPDDIDDDDSEDRTTVPATSEDDYASLHTARYSRSRSRTPPPAAPGSSCLLTGPCQLNDKAEAFYVHASRLPDRWNVQICTSSPSLCDLVYDELRNSVPIEMAVFGTGDALGPKAETAVTQSSLPPFGLLKLLSSPTNGHIAADRAFDTLRRITAELGGNWPHFANQGLLPAYVGVESNSSDEDSDDAVVRWVSVLVLKPMYSPEQLSVVIQFPATVADVKDAVQAARDPEWIDAFPHLWEASPQPSDSLVVMLAMPQWNAMASVICVDCRAIDGRLFALEAPDYVDRQGLLMLIDLPSTTDAQLFIDMEDQPMQPGIQSHLFPAVTVTIVPAASDVPPRRRANELFRQAASWQDFTTQEPPVPGQYYCLILEYGFRLFVADLGRPWRYRSQIADAVGVPVSSLTVFPIAAPVRDAVVDGYHCSGAIIGVPTHTLGRDGLHFCFVFDCRRLLEGWACMCTASEYVPVELALERLRDITPRNWTVTFGGVLIIRGCLRVAPGSVVQVYPRPPGPHAVVAVHTRPGAEPTVDNTGGTGDTPHGTGPAPSPSVPPVPNDPNQAIPGRSDHTDAAPLPVAETRSLGLTPFVAVFQVLQVGYQASLYEVSLIAPTVPQEAKDRVADQRPAVDCRRFPELVEAFPQPDTSFGVLVAVPAWDNTGVIAVIDARLFGGTIYPASMPGQVDKQAILLHSGHRDRVDCSVYLRDMPWPLIEQHTIQLSVGDLIILAPTQHPAIISASLDDMLLSSDGWASAESIQPSMPRHICVLTDQAACHCEFPTPAGHALEHAIGIAIDTDVHEFVVLHTWPSLTDACSYGEDAREVCLAVPADHGPQTGQHTWIVLDFRPLLGEITPIRVFGDSFDAHVPYRSLFLTPPFGFRLCAYGGHATGSPERAVFRVSPGVVITFEYRPYDHVPAATSRAELSPHAEIHNAQANSNAWVQRAAGQCHVARTVSGLDSLKTGGPTSRNRYRARSFLNWLQAVFSSISVPSDRRGLSSRGRRSGSLLRSKGLFLCCFAAQLSTSVAAPICSAISPFDRGLGTRSIPTPCRTSCVVSCAPTDDALPVPNVEAVSGDTICVPATTSLPCAADVCPDDSKSLETVGPTLLEQAARRADCKAFALASAYITILVEHAAGSVFDSATPTITDSPGTPGSVTESTTSLRCAPSVLSLEAGIPLSPHQVSSQALSSLLPHSCQPDEMDWLDADLTPLLQDSQVPLELRTRFLNLVTWHSAGCPAATGLEIYTDGSASAHDQDVRPCSWAISVWVHSGDKTYLLGWAAAQAAPRNTPFFVGERTDTALTAEFLGIIWGLVWSAEFGEAYHLPVVFRYDAIGAGGAVFGASAAPRSANSPHTDLVRLATSLRHYVQTRIGLQHAHVPGHRGHIANELVDQLAKQVRRRQDDPWLKCLPSWPAKLAVHPMQDWAWATLPATDVPTLFAMESEAFRLQGTDRSLPQPPLQGLCQQRCEPGVLRFRLTCISVNVLTLRDPYVRGKPPVQTGMYMTGRKAMLQRSLAEHQPILVGIQETRLFESQCQPDPEYIVLHSAATPHGHGGCALWIAKQRPFAVQGREEYFFKEQDVTVVSFSPRHLAVNLTTPRFSLFVLVLHTPSLANTPWEDVNVFWKARAEDLARRPEGAEYVILADTNARVGSVASQYIGHLDEEPEHDAGSLLHDFLIQIDALLPSTFPEFHVGFSGTWKQPNGEWHRLDYVIVPSEWSAFELRSRVLTNVELLQKREDHLPVLLECAFARHLPGQVYWTSAKRTCRPAPSHRETLPAIQAFASVHSAEWRVDADAHYQDLVTQWQQAAAPFCQTESRPIKQAYIQPATLELVDIRRALRQYLAAEGLELRRRRLALGFAAFSLAARGLHFAPAAIALLNYGLRDMDHSIARAIALLSWYAGRLRKAVAADRRQYLHTLAEAAAQRDFRDPRELYNAIRRAFPKARSSRRGSFKPLPSLTKADGTPAITSVERAECWRQHFATQEAGELIAADDYPDRMAYLKHEPAPRVFDLDVVPTLGATEQVILGLRNQKAAGPDGLSAEVLKLHTASTARQLLPVLLKSALRLREPTGWRGGDLVVLAKKASTVLRCEHFRSVLVSNLAGKVYHRCVRNSLKPHLSRTQPELVGGVKEGLGVEFPALAVRTFAAQMHALREPWGVVFYDLAAAYYSVVRQSLVPNSDSDEGLLALFHSLRLPPEALSELKRHLVQAAELPKLGVESHLVEIVRDLLTGSWFRLAGHAALTVTHKGSRPGDPAADILFAFTLSAYLRQVQRLLADAGLARTLRRPVSRPAWMPDIHDFSIGNPAWADDFTQPVFAPRPCQLLHDIRRSVSLLTSHASACGMTIKFGVEKTAVVLSELVRARVQEDLECDHTGQAFIPVRDTARGENHQLPVVRAYKHLGGILVSTASPTPDLYHRYSRAAGTARPLKKVLFGSRQFDLAVRRNLLSSLVLSKYTHTAAAVILRSACHLRLWERHYVALWRQLCPRAKPDSQLHPYGVLQLAQAPSPPLALAGTRAQFLLKLVRPDSSALLVLLCDHHLFHPASSWLGQLSDDVQCVAQYLPQIRLLLPAGTEVSALLQAAQENPGWWVSQVNKAKKIFQQDLRRWANGTPHAQPADMPTSDVKDPTGDRPSVPSELPFKCGVCGKCFRLRKHAAVHAARAHGHLSPSRHYAITEHCTACLRYYGVVTQVQQHLKASLPCLVRCSLLHPPLTKEEIAQIEAPTKRRQKRLRAGNWHDFTGLPPPARVPLVLGPCLPTADERACGRTDSEETLLSDLRRAYRPTSTVEAWIRGHVEGRSSEGPRSTAARFWHQRPEGTGRTSVPFHFSNSARVLGRARM